ncbi:DUF2716 domain-containing protein [Shouchella lehensis]|uniref:DUF2716 domain-containing protein n=1 Tax=Shouchella lehensis G1 TaxID=1246626 RepID=A0A060LYS6_9BACI|nr:DUF2716 domain-containing protein [Shouchella lehensis]AIC93438.1 hypothetical protein BleG1_0830 [Shouchella lehensis G1]
MNVRLLHREEAEFVWSVIGKRYGYPDSGRRFKLPKPYIRFDISTKFACETDELERAVLTTMKACTIADETIYAMDWQHECYEFDPRKPIERDEWNEWLVPLFPNGDYVIFLQKDFQWGYFGHPWKKEIAVFGESFIWHLNVDHEILDTVMSRGSRD